MPDRNKAVRERHCSVTRTERFVRARHSPSPQNLSFMS